MTPKTIIPSRRIDLAAWARRGPVADLPTVAWRLGLPPVHTPRHQRHAYRDGWWSLLVADPRHDDEAHASLAVWARAIGCGIGLTLPIHDWAGHRREAWVQITDPEAPYRVAARIWVPLAPDWNGPAERLETDATGPASVAAARLLAGITGGSVTR